MSRFDGAAVVVLGATGVLGGIFSRELAARGARLVVAGRNRSRLDDLVASIPGSVPVELDLRDPSAAVRPVEAALRAFGSVDGVVNAAGVVAFGGLDELDPHVLDELFATDLVGPLRVLREALPHLDGGFAVNMTGVVAEQPTAGMAAYSAAKAGLSAASRALGRELRRRSILVVDARPPHTETGLATRPIAGRAPAMNRGLDPEAVVARVLKAVDSGEREVPAEAFS